MEKDVGFEYAFLTQVFVDEIQKKEFLKNDIEYSILTEPKHFINDFKEIPDWVTGRTSTILNIIESLKNIVNVAMPKFLGEPGEPSDLKGLYYVSVRYSELYEQLLNWIIITKSTKIDKDFEDAKMILAKFASSPAKAIWDFPFEIQSQIEIACKKLKLGEEDVKVNVTLTLEIEEGVENEFEVVFDRLRKYYGI